MPDDKPVNIQDPNSNPEKARLLKREVYREWAPATGAPKLPSPPPTGNRTPNGLIWGHSVGDFFTITGTPVDEGPVVDQLPMVWSRSMIKKLGRAYGAFCDDDKLEPMPRLRRPWPVLKLTTHLDPTGSTLGVIDEGSDQEETLTDCEDLSDSEGEHEAEATCLVGMPAKEDCATQTSGTTAAPPDHGGLHMSANTGAVANDVPPPAKITSQGSESPPLATTSGCTVVNDASPVTPVRIPKLEEFIPDEYLPDILIVNDPDSVCSTPGRRGSVRTYKRLYPKQWSFLGPRYECQPTATSASSPGLDDIPKPRQPVTAHLNIRSSDKIGSGHHSFVFRASLGLPDPLSVSSPNNEVTVAAKVALPENSARDLLKNEGKTYNRFPRHLQEDWSGFNVIEEFEEYFWSGPARAVPPVGAVPVGVMPVGAVVPKFYGYYVPDGDGNVDAVGENCQNAELCKNRAAKERPIESPILLIEECGEEIQVYPTNLARERRLECFSLWFRLHRAQILQQSAYIRNMLIQPGPLTLPPEKRSLETPSFRIIDFGRAKKSTEDSQVEVATEIRHAWYELSLDNHSNWF